MAFPVQIVSLSEGVALVASDTQQFEVGRLFMPEAKIGDWALVHSGQLVGLLAPRERDALRELIREMNALAAAYASDGTLDG